MRALGYIPTLLTIAAAFSTVSAWGPLPKYPQEGSVLANMDGLPPCYGWCFATHSDMPVRGNKKDDLAWRDLGEWCHRLREDRRYWYYESIYPCMKEYCPLDDATRDSMDAWWDAKCPGQLMFHTPGPLRYDPKYVPYYGN